MIQIETNGRVIANDFDQMRSEFAAYRCLRLPGLLGRTALGFLHRKLEETAWIVKDEKEGELEFGSVLYVPDNEPVRFVFQLLMNNRELFRVLEKVTGCRPIGNFSSRIHRSVPNTGHHIEWHGDNTDARMLGFTVFLSDEEYEGGVFQLRHKTMARIMCEVPRSNAGDAFVFQIAPDLQHRLCAVERGGSRTVGVGWFRSEPAFALFARNQFQFS